MGKAQGPSWLLNFLLNNVTPCTVIKDCTFIRELRILNKALHAPSLRGECVIPTTVPYRQHSTLKMWNRYHGKTTRSQKDLKTLKARTTRIALILIHTFINLERLLLPRNWFNFQCTLYAVYNSISYVSYIMTYYHNVICRLRFYDIISLRSRSSAPLISRYILRLGQEAQKQQRLRCSNRKMYLEFRGADEWAFRLHWFNLHDLRFIDTLEEKRYFTVFEAKSMPNIIISNV